MLSDLRERWGTREFAVGLLQEACPTLYPDEEFRGWFTDSLRVGATPAVAHALNRAYYESHLSDVLPAVRMPMLVLYRQGFASQDEDALGVACRIPDIHAMRVSRSDHAAIFLTPRPSTRSFG